MDVVLLSRIQFALTIMFHYLFPPLTIGMGVVMVYLEGRHLWKGDVLYARANDFWVRIFGLNFAIGVATGIVMEFQFGTNWANYSRFVGDVFGSALAAEGIFAFFLESGFLAVVLFGRGRVRPGFYFFSILMVALGSIFSSVWIVVANSWQQTPAGFDLVPWTVNGQTMLRAEITNFWAMVFNPSTVHRLTHVLIGCFITGAFFIMSISAFYILRDRHVAFAKRSFRGALLFGTIFSLAALFSGHLQAKNVYHTQPAKLAAFEGHYRSGPADLSLFAIPVPGADRLALNLAVPGGVSFLLHEDFDAHVAGLDRFREEDRPPVAIPFTAYHLMVGLGTLFIALTLTACVFLWRGTLFRQRWLMWIFVFSVIGAVVANQAGWIAAEVGRQPWIVHPPMESVWKADGTLATGPDGKVDFPTTTVRMPDGAERTAVIGLRTTDGVSEAIHAGQVASSIVFFGLIYLLLGGVWLFLLNHKIQAGPPPLRPAETSKAVGGLISAATDRAGHGRSMLDPDPADDKEARE